MIDNLVDCQSDILKDLAKSNNVSELWNALETFKEQLTPLARVDDMEGIRAMFKGGWTVLLAGKLMGEIESEVLDNDELEIRIYNKNDKLLGVIINSEIAY